MSILWEKSEMWRWIVRKTRDSKPFFLMFATVCGVVPGVIGYGVMQITNSRNQQLESHLRHKARPDSLIHDSEPTTIKGILRVSVTATLSPSKAALFLSSFASNNWQAIEVPTIFLEVYDQPPHY
ncbi:uncharacterized protein LOC114286069 isoform X2 [Camellia sinensis]|uniref:uncharacterized protein LOC114286069 isoform X2 n=1 Tax=Camellia sinensis TaxID=4442 RepID=UPI001035D131|nr:uncharacterized protein LOC114286069 isoform X2 [Camellia sinensis]